MFAVNMYGRFVPFVENLELQFSKRGCYFLNLRESKQVSCIRLHLTIIISAKPNHSRSFVKRCLPRRSAREETNSYNFERYPTASKITLRLAATKYLNPSLEI